MEGVFGTDWPAASVPDDSVRVEFFDATGEHNTMYWLHDDNGTRKWKKRNLDTNEDEEDEDASPTEFPTNFFGRGFSITLPTDLGGVQEFTRTVAVRRTNDAGKVSVTNVTVGGMNWYPILQVPTNGPSGAAGFSADVAYGYRTVENGVRKIVPQFTLVNLNLPVAVDVSELGLVRTDSNGNWIGKTTNNGTIHWDGILPGNGTTIGDVIYTYDNETKEVRDNSLIYYNNTQRKWVNSYGTGTTFYPNDAIVIKSMGLYTDGPEPGTTWKWTSRSPTNYYGNTVPNRHMGRQ